MKNFKFAIVAMIIVGALFGTGCSDLNQTFHEKAGIIISDISPQILKPTNSGTTEADLYNSGTFPSTTIHFRNLNGIPVVLKSYKVDYYDTTDGSKKGNLTFSGRTVFTIPGATDTSSTSSSTTSTTSSTTTSTSSTSAASDSGLTIYLWSQAVKDEIYGNTATSADNKQLIANIDIYGEDYSGNSVQISASVTLTP